MDGMRIGELAKRARVTQRTVRFYERLGLIPEGERVGNGQHRYPELTLARLEKIGRLKQIGLSLDEIGEVIEFYFTDATGKEPKRSILAILRRHLEETDGKITALAAFRADVQGHITRFERWLQENNRL